MEEKNEIMDIKETAFFLKIKPRTLYRLVEKGNIPGIKIGGQWRFSRKVIEGLFSKE